MKNYSRLNASHGLALITVLIVMLTLALIGATLIEFSSSVALSNQTFADEAKALYLAEAGIHYAIHRLRQSRDSNVVMEKNIPPVSLGEGTFEVVIDKDDGMIVSTGIVNGITKRLSLQYNLF